ncbi:hypothetical protein J3R82DRAFT_7593 [Butyriboletus roseoflavus]|nr:hypothetical protein J3R82DRAFT_7593 [Butyriboletus roseoflavus]
MDQEPKHVLGCHRPAYRTRPYSMFHPKGQPTASMWSTQAQVWYEDLTGSGVETISHVRENGRITVMFCALEGPPRILRLFGVGTVHEYGSPEYNRLIPATARKPGSRAAIVIDVYQVGSSCGFAVPLYDFVMHRTQLARISDKVETVDRMLAASRDQQRPDQEEDLPRTTENGDDKESKSQLSLRTYWLLKNKHSLDGLPGLLTAPDAILSMTPQSHFDKDGPRPMLRRNTAVFDTVRDRKWFVSGAMVSIRSGVTASLTVLSVLGLAQTVPLADKLRRLSPSARDLMKRSTPAAPHFTVYNDLWLDQFPSASDLQGFNVFALAFLMSAGAVDEAQNWQSLTDSDRTTYVQEYNAAGISLIVSAFGSTDTPTSSGVDPVTLANTMAAWVTQYGVNGIDVDYEVHSPILPSGIRAYN